MKNLFLQTAKIGEFNSHIKGRLCSTKKSSIPSPHRTRDKQNSLKITKIISLPISISVNPRARQIAIPIMLQKALATLQNASVARGVTHGGQFLADKKIE